MPTKQAGSMPQVLEAPIPGLTPQTKEQKQERLAQEKAAFTELVAKRDAENAAKAAPPPKTKAAPKAETPHLAAEPETEKPKAAAAPAPKYDEELAALRAELAELKAAAKPKEPEPEPEEEPEIAPELSEQFGESETKALMAMMKPLLDRISSMEKMIENAQKQSVEQLSKSQRQRLAEKNPLLAKSERAWEALHRSVLEDFEKNPKKYPDVDSAYNKAYADFYGEDEEPEAAVEEEKPDLAAAEKEKEEETVSRIKASSPSTPGHAKREKKGDVLSASYKAFQHLQKHPGDVNGARGAFRNMIVQ